MIVIPSIDLMDGKCVRLIRGEKRSCIEYEVDPTYMARQYIDKGAKLIHVVDLDGAFTGEMKNIEIIKQLAKQFPIQVGGGIRDEQRIKDLLSSGVKKVVLSTLLIRFPELADKIKKQYRGRIIGSLDFKNGKIGYAGWTRGSDIELASFTDGLEEIIVTDTERDGTFGGPNIELLTKVKRKCKASIIAAGGIRDVFDIMELKKSGIDGVIIGRAFFEKKISLKNGFRFQLVD